MCLNCGCGDGLMYDQEFKDSPFFERHFLPGDRVKIVNYGRGGTGKIVEMEKSPSGLGVLQDGQSLHPTYNWPESSLELIERNGKICSSR
jgi:hypothetical protein